MATQTISQASQASQELCWKLRAQTPELKPRTSALHSTTKHAVLLEQIENFEQWVGHHDALGQGPSSLHVRLADKTLVREDVLRLLIKLSESLEQCLDLILDSYLGVSTGEPVEAQSGAFLLLEQAEASAPSIRIDNDDEPMTELGELVKIVRDSVHALDGRVRFFRRDIHGGQQHTFDSSNELFKHQILQQCPSLHGSSILVKRFAEAARKRRSDVNANARDDIEPFADMEREGSSVASQERGSSRRGDIPMFARRIQTASASLKSHAQQSERNGHSGSNLLAPPMAYTHVTGTSSNYGHGRLARCPMCNELRWFESRHAYKTHAFGDLKAYVCTVEDCNSPIDAQMFPTQREWYRHEMHEHRREWQCRLCVDFDFISSEWLKKHIMSQHKSSGYTEAQLPAILESCSKSPSHLPLKDCPFCGGNEDSPQADSNKERRVTTKVFMDHLARHLEDLAEFSFPNADPFSHDTEATSSPVSPSEVSDGPIDVDEELMGHARSGPTRALPAPEIDDAVVNDTEPTVCSRLGDLIRTLFLTDSTETGTEYGDSLSFSAQIELRKYVHEQMDGDCDLDDILTVSGSGLSAYATTCKAYVAENWGEPGLDVLRLVSAALVNQGNGTTGSASVPGYIANLQKSDVDTTIEGETTEELRFTFEHDRVEGLDTTQSMPEKAIAIAQTLAWMAATFRVSKSERPSSSTVFANREGSTIHIALEQMTPVPDAHQHACWQQLFPGFVIAMGFPSRQPGTHGLDIPFEVMLLLSRVKYQVNLAEHFKSTRDTSSAARDHVTDPARATDALAEVDDSQDFGIYYCGLDSFLYPTSHDLEHDTVKWHYEKPRQSRTPREEALCRVKSLATLQGSRCVLGYTAKAVVHLGTVDRADRDLQDCNADMEEGSVAIQLDNVTLGAGNVGSHGIFSASFKIKYAKSLRVEPREGVEYEEVLDRARETPVILLETEFDLNRAWLVSQLSVILELVHTKVSQQQWRKISHAQLQADGGQAAYDVLKVRNNMRHKLRKNQDDSSYRIYHLVNAIWIEMDKRSQVNAQSEKKEFGTIAFSSRHIYGWDLLELIEPLKPYQRRQITLDGHQDMAARTKPSWFALAQVIPVFFCRNLGELITAEPDDSGTVCQHWKSIPGNQQYLVASIPALLPILNEDDYGHCCLKNTRMMWECYHRELFASCRVSRRSKCRCAERVQSFKERDKKAVAQGAFQHWWERLYRDGKEGAVVFGPAHTKASKLDGKLDGFLRKGKGRLSSTFSQISLGSF